MVSVVASSMRQMPVAMSSSSGATSCSVVGSALAGDQQLPIGRA